MARTPLTDVAMERMSDLDNTSFGLLKAKMIDHDNALDFIGAPIFTAVGVTAGSFAEVVTSGALSLSAQVSYLSVTGTVAYTLANGTVDGQLKEIECTVAATTPQGTLTVTAMDTAGGGANATFVFNTVSQRLTLKWNAANAGWHAVAKVRAGSLAVFVGTTVLTGFNMNQVYALSVTGTVTSTGTKAIPAGCVPGEQIHVLTPTAASTPSGTINIAGTTVATGAAATALSGINATSVQAQFAWDPTNSWQNLSVTTATYS
ncbi:MAG TPA: hypothetical protein VKR80_07400 [Candidatus Limnocylindria bacterium]|nr:hypothetical protein [Candidatus Limnocylindria bacterium]